MVKHESTQQIEMTILHTGWVTLGSGCRHFAVYLCYCVLQYSQAFPAGFVNKHGCCYWQMQEGLSSRVFMLCFYYPPSVSLSLSFPITFFLPLSRLYIAF